MQLFGYLLRSHLPSGYNNGAIWMGLQIITNLSELANEESEKNMVYQLLEQTIIQFYQG